MQRQTHSGAVLVHLSPGTGTPDGYALAWEGAAVGHDILAVGRHTDDFMSAAPPQPVAPGLFVWEGEIVYTDHGEDWDSAWTGTWRPARIADLRRFHLLAAT